MTYITQFAAATYNCGTYGSGAYDEGQCASTGATGGGLADTGYDVLLPIFLGVSLLIAGSILIAKRWLRKRKAQASQL
ncbi:MAG TPA: hypothetical protein VFO38_04900 [Candidatus Saccharimonadales bacterium]|nr:hypothetical protein [Candidatus Saccharimonadales bacterium]